MRNKKWWTSLALVGLLVAASLPAQEPPKRVRIAYPSNTICCLPLFGRSLGKSSNRTAYKRKSFK